MYRHTLSCCTISCGNAADHTAPYKIIFAYIVDDMLSRFTCHVRLYTSSQATNTCQLNGLAYVLQSISKGRIR